MQHFQNSLPIIKAGRIAVYAGKGAKTAEETAYSIGAEIDQDFHRIDFVDAADIRKGTILKETSLLVWPGGEDRYYCEELDTQAVSNIADQARWRALLTFCAGTFLCADTISYHEGLADEIIASRPVKIFPGTAHSIDHKHGYIYDGKAGSIFASRIRLKNDVAFDAYCHGGCALIPNPGFEFGLIGSDLMAEARYDSLPGKPVAIARVNYPEGGVAILSGVHFEMPWAVVAHRLPGQQYAPLIASLEAGEKLRRMLMRSVLRQSHVRVKHDPLPIEPLISFLQLPPLLCLREACL